MSIFVVHLFFIVIIYQFDLLNHLEWQIHFFACHTTSTNLLLVEKFLLPMPQNDVVIFLVQFDILYRLSGLYYGMVKPLLIMLGTPNIMGKDEAIQWH